MDSFHQDDQVVYGYKYWSMIVVAEDQTNPGTA